MATDVDALAAGAAVGLGSQTHNKGPKFWTYLAALDTSIISTALPTMTADLASESLYVWLIDAYLLASTATIPIFAQAANIYGRRSLMLISVCLFALGSGLCGGASNNAMMIGGRCVQGIGGGGILTMSEIIVCDLVSIRERGLYAGILGGIWAIASVVAPIIGGAFAQNITWRCIFYINLPNVRRLHHRSGALSTASTAAFWHPQKPAIILALSWGGSTIPWSSWRTIVPLVLGFLGLISFFAYQAAPWLTDPTMPLRLFGNRTAVTVFIMSFIHSMLLFWICYFLPVYFQGVKEASPSRSAVMLFPIATTSAPGGVMAGVCITKSGKYRVWHLLGFGLMALGCGLFTLLDENTSTGKWVGFQLLFGFGCGFVFTSCLPPILASLPDSDVATATGAWTFVRNFGSIWGIAIPAAVFNTHANRVASQVSDPSVRALLVNGGAYGHATREFITRFNADPALKSEISSLYLQGLNVVWDVSVAFSLLGLAVACFVPSIELKEELNTEYGMKEAGTKPTTHLGDEASPR